MSQEHIAQLYTLTDGASDAAFARARAGHLKSFRPMPLDDLRVRLASLEPQVAAADARVMRCLKELKYGEGRQAFNQALSLNAELAALREALEERRVMMS
ncbi:hypothetical protein D3C71_21050 [compost metagenome]